MAHLSLVGNHELHDYPLLNSDNSNMQDSLTVITEARSGSVVHECFSESFHWHLKHDLLPFIHLWMKHANPKTLLVELMSFTPLASSAGSGVPGDTSKTTSLRTPTLPWTRDPHTSLPSDDKLHNPLSPTVSIIHLGLVKSSCEVRRRVQKNVKWRKRLIDR